MEEELRDLARLLLRAGLGTPAEARRELVEAIARDLPGEAAASRADEWLAAARADLLAEEKDWPEHTDHDDLLAAFAACETMGVRVLRGVPDHWSAKQEIDRLAGRLGARPLRGIVWFTPPDVWHAIDHGMLEINLWHPTTANAAPGDDLLADVLSLLGRHGLSAHFDEGRIEIAAHWRRRVPDKPGHFG